MKGMHAGDHRGKQQRWHTRDEQQRPTAEHHGRPPKNEPRPQPATTPPEDKPRRQTTDAPLRNQDKPYVEKEIFYDATMDRAVEHFAGIIACANPNQLACVGISRTGRSAHVVIYKSGEIGPIYLPRGYNYFNSGRGIEGMKLVTADWMMIEMSPFFAPAFGVLTKLGGDVRLVADPRKPTRSWVEINDEIVPIVLKNGRPTTGTLIKREGHVVVMALTRHSIRTAAPKDAVSGKIWKLIGTSPVGLHTRISRAIDGEQTFIGLTRRGYPCTVNVPTDGKQARVILSIGKPFPPGREVIGATENGKSIVVTGDGGDKTNVTISPRAIVPESAPETEPPPANA